MHMKDHLEKQHGFRDIDVLTEKSGNEPTLANILASLRALAQKTHKGVDHAVIQYSGHGTSVRDSSGDEDDRKDEAWYTLDKKLVLDDDVRSILDTFSPWCEVLIIVDACHSGTGLDLPIKYVNSADVVEIENNTAPLCNALMISGCRDTETSADVTTTTSAGRKEFGGAMTKSLFACSPTSANVFELIHNMHAYMRKNGFAQRPQLSSSRPLDGTEHLTRWLR